ncbi:MAG: hypothetical protein AAGI11_02855 [Pseudomonadota bacterium]
MRNLVVMLLLFVCVTGCKLRIVVPQGGSVQTESTAFSCSANDTCTIDVVDLFFDETFVGVPNSGWVFEGWRRGNNRLCGGRTDSCNLTTGEFGGIRALLDILESDEVYFLQPIFVRGEESNFGRWSGRWTNTSFSSVGALRMTATQRSNNRARVTVDLDGFVGGLLDPEPQSVNATIRNNGDITYSGQIDVNGSPGTLEFRLRPNGNLSISMPDLPVAGFRSFSATGTLRGGVGFLEYEVEFSPTGSARGTVSATRQ